MRSLIDFMMSKFKTYDMFRIYGIPIRMNISFLLLGLLVLINTGSLTLSVISLIVLAISLVAHELGHCLAAKKFGYDTYDITMTILGGLASIKMIRNMRPNEEIKVAFAGPRVSFIIMAISFIMLTLFVIVGSMSKTVEMMLHVPTLFFGISMWLNMCLGVFNLIPAFPMDGGRIFRAWLSKKKSHLDATKFAIKVAKGFAIALSILGVISLLLGNAGGLTMILVALFLWLAGKTELDHEMMTLRYRP